MSKVDRSLVLESQGTRTDPAVPATVPLGNYFRIILTFHDSLQPMKDIGFIPGIVMHDMATGVIPVSAIAQLEAMPNVVRVDIDRRVSYKLEASRTEIKADKVQKPPQDANVMGYDGSGVVVGIIDWGFDYRHRTFRKGDGTGGTRIVRLWDQEATPWQPGLNYGKKYTQQDIDAALAGYADPNQRLAYTSDDKHGSHVAGIAAGAGWMEDGARKYVGIAPGADLILVSKSSDGTGGMTVEAIAYIAQEAQALGKRCVINMSLGYTGFACDGFSPVDRCMNAIASEYPDVILVASAGNNGGYDFHFQGQVTAQPLDVPVTIWAETCVVYLWYAGSEHFTLTVTPPASSNQGPPKVYDPNTNDAIVHTFAQGNQVSLASEVHPYNGKRCITAIFREGARDQVAPGLWWLKLTGPSQVNGIVHAWIDYDVSKYQRFHPGFLQPSPAATVESPGCADRVIAVGAYVTQNSEKLNAQFELGSLAFFSSRGPLLSPGMQPAARVKPDISAPGMFIRSASARFKEEPNDPVVSKTHGEGGTSQAAPHVAGIIALLLQKEPSLTFQQVYDRITQTARQDAQTGPVPNANWGFGKIDAWAALFAALPPNATGAEAESLVPEQLRQSLKDLGESMTRSAEGRAYLDFVTRHRGDIIALIRRHRRVNAAWLRAGAPVVHALLTHLRTPDSPLPTVVYGRSVRVRLQQFLRALGRYGGGELRTAVASLADPLPMDGLTINQIRARFAGEQ